MLKTIALKNFSIFKEANFKFGSGINIVIGGNGTGKTHLLKAAHCYLNSIIPVKGAKDEYIFSVGILGILLINYFSPLGALIGSKRKSLKNDKNIHLFKEQVPVEGGVTTDFYTLENRNTNNDVTTYLEDFKQLKIRSIVIPPKEVLSLSSWLLGISEKFNIEIDQSYPDLLKHLNLPTLKVLPYPEVISEIERIIGGEIIKDGDRFYIVNSDGGRLESNLMAEGHRKLAMIAYLLKNGSLNKDITLFWDEPEANLNPTLIRKLASILTILATNGFQIVLATHSLFLMKELHLLSKEAKPVHYIGLIKENDSVRVTEAEDLDELELIESLEAELDQSIRYLNS